MKKIAIITELSLKSTNYGNNIQAYALNKFLRLKYPDYTVETILLKKGTGRKITSFIFYVKRIVRKVVLLTRKKKDETINLKKKSFNDFVAKYIITSHNDYTFKELKSSNYDFYIVGSDIVWIQSRGFVNKSKFLAFTPKLRNAKKIAYAASFGENNIPPENEKSIKKYLSKFNALSVREYESIKFLNKHGISGVQHVCDPVLLLTRDEWDTVSEDVNNISAYEKNKFAFVYIIGPNKHENEINNICKQFGIQPIFVSCTKQTFNEIGEFKCFDNCSPQEWIWMIKHSEFVFTDSFHGLVFSTIFQKRFFVINRRNNKNLNIRMSDYLCKIEETDKLVDITHIGSLSNYSWDYNKIKKNMDAFIKVSQDFLLNSLECMP